MRFSDFCANCRKSLAQVERILFVEKELGRCFCCEECIQDYFQPTVEFMEEEYRKLRSEGDFTELEALRLSHYRGLTLEDPDEIWIDQTDTGERHHIFISHFSDGEARTSYVVVALAIDGVPSFVFLGFPTRDENLVDEYRRGIDAKKPQPHEQELTADLAALPEPALALREEGEEPIAEDPGAADPFAERSAFERLYLELRQPGDIPQEKFGQFEPAIEPTLDDADEIWRLIDAEGNEWFTFIARHVVGGTAENGDDAIDEFTMIVVCEPAFEDGARTLEVIFAFPTIDPGLVQHFRKGINSLNKAFGVGWTRGRVA